MPTCCWVFKCPSLFGVLKNVSTLLKIMYLIQFYVNKIKLTLFLSPKDIISHIVM
jgi:hypothetical protein